VSPTALFEQVEFILGSGSPRRKYLLEGLGLPFEVITKDTYESFPESLVGGEIPTYLAQKKAQAFEGQLNENQLLITADTVVWIDNTVLNKPIDREAARKMLEQISGNTHSVFTAVCLKTHNRQHTFCEETRVEFHDLTSEEIAYYLDRYAPLDKAGAYGIQEFIGYIGIKQVTGDFYNVVGFPVQRFWKELPTFLSAE